MLVIQILKQKIRGVIVALRFIADKYKHNMAGRVICKACNTYNATAATKCGWCGAGMHKSPPTPKPAPKPEPKPAPVISPREQAQALIDAMSDEQLKLIIHFGNALKSSDAS